MARSEHLPIYKASYDLCLYFEQVVHSFSRYHKYAIGSHLREGALRVLRLVVRANARRDPGRPRRSTAAAETGRWTACGRLSRAGGCRRGGALHRHVERLEAEIARLRADLERERADRERWADRMVDRKVKVPDA